MKDKLDIFLVAGEASADSHAASLILELKKIKPHLSFFGVGGKELSRVGMEVILDSSKVNVVGMTDWMERMAQVILSYLKISKLLSSRRPDLAILLDLPDFNLRLSRKLKKLGVPVVYYISPQVWAWRKYRVRTIRERIGKMITILPFEQDFYRNHGVDATFVGHPLAESTLPKSSHRPHAQVTSEPRIAILPGSRPSELRYHAPIVRSLIQKLKDTYPDVHISIPIASTLSIDTVRKQLRVQGVDFTHEPAPSLFQWADIAVVASGTATLEATLTGIPFCIYYKISRTSAFCMDYLFQYRGYVGMPNILAGRQIVGEYLQQFAKADLLFAECRKLIDDALYRRSVLRNIEGCRKLLGPPGASARAAHEILSFFNVESNPTTEQVFAPHFLR